MKIERIYPSKEEKKVQRQDIIAWAKRPFLLAGLVCCTVNLCVGGPAWSPVVLWSLWICWSSLFSPDLVEYNRISQTIKLITQVSILLILINALLVPGWAMEVVPIVCYGGLLITGILFFTDLDRQRRNFLPIFLLSIVSILCAIAGLLFGKAESNWALLILGMIAFLLLVTCFIVLGRDFIQELRKQFYTR